MLVKITHQNSLQTNQNTKSQGLLSFSQHPQYHCASIPVMDGYEVFQSSQTEFEEG